MSEMNLSSLSELNVHCDAINLVLLYHTCIITWNQPVLRNLQCDILFITVTSSTSLCYNIHTRLDPTSATKYSVWYFIHHCDVINFIMLYHM